MAGFFHAQAKIGRVQNTETGKLATTADVTKQFGIDEFGRNIGSPRTSGATKLGTETPDTASGRLRKGATTLLNRGNDNLARPTLLGG